MLIWKIVRDTLSRQRHIFTDRHVRCLTTWSIVFCRDCFNRASCWSPRSVTFWQISAIVPKSMCSCSKKSLCDITGRYRGGMESACYLVLFSLYATTHKFRPPSLQQTVKRSDETHEFCRSALLLIRFLKFSFFIACRSLGTYCCRREETCSIYCCCSWHVYSLFLYLSPANHLHHHRSLPHALYPSSLYDDPSWSRPTKALFTLVSHRVFYTEWRSFIWAILPSHVRMKSRSYFAPLTGSFVERAFEPGR